MKCVGVDGCRGGWLAVSTDDGARWEVALHREFAGVWRAHPDAVTVFVDIPIGLPSQGDRRADGLARRRLGPRGSSVFNVPARQAVWAMDAAGGQGDLAARKEAARSFNRQLVGKSISEQSLGIVPKILEVDRFLSAAPEVRGRIFEAHPELCFAMAVGRPMEYAKKDFLGGLERLGAVEAHVPGARALLARVRREHPRSVVDADDVLDAMILAVSAHACGGRPASLPDPPERDGTGLPMAIWFHDFSTEP
jgi:predicted RNase H-like nuclease